MQFNDPKGPYLPPVDCKLVIKIGDNEVLATRTGYVESKDSKLEYRLDSTNELVSGHFWWRYT